MAYLTSLDHYLRFEEMASGRGYSDILFLPRAASQKPALLIELKWDKSADRTITQIMDKQYLEIMEKFGYKGKMLLVGVNYSTKTGKHTCKIEDIMDDVPLQKKIHTPLFSRTTEIGYHSDILSYSQIIREIFWLYENLIRSVVKPLASTKESVKTRKKVLFWCRNYFYRLDEALSQSR